MKRLLTILALCGIASLLHASEMELEKVTVGTDVQTVGRGAEAVMNDCHSCHSMKYIRYRDLVNFGMDRQKVDGWRGDLSLDAPLLAQMPESDAAQAYGKAPPDLSLMTKAREGGVRYVYSYLLGYYLTPEGMPGNHYFPETKMPDVLGISGVTEGAQRTELQGKARDIVSFLAWSADPHEQERHRLGYYVIAYLLVLTVLLYLVKNQVWSGLK
ncbi:MAG: cytochrome C [Nitrosomonadales bacterium]|nr:cytochrome C [Nitrosomonadales bacterium]